MKPYDRIKKVEDEYSRKLRKELKKYNLVLKNDTKPIKKLPKL